MSEQKSGVDLDGDDSKNPQVNSEEVDQEFEAMRQRIKEMEDEAQRLKEMQAQVERELNLPSSDAATENKEDVDARSIYIGNVDYHTLPQELQAHFQSCGVINRVTILCDKHTGHPKGCAYVEFSDPQVVQNALALNESLFKGRIIKVCAKRTNIPGMSRGRPRGYRGYRYRPYYNSYPRHGAINGFRSRRGYYAPY